MSHLTATSFLERNLASLGSRNQDVADAIRSSHTHADFVLIESKDDVPAGMLGSRLLCSKVHPLQEARRLTSEIDLVEHAVVVVLGFGMGWHVRALAERSDKSVLLLVYEPDIALLRTVFEQVDHSSWMADALLMIVTDADDRGALASKLVGAEAIVGQGVHVLEHPASRMRLGDQSPRFLRNFSEQVATARTTLATTLMRSVDTTRNLLRNIDHYVNEPGITELEGAAAGWPAVIVSAGPSLHRNLHILKNPGVRDCCVIIAVQTALRPMLKEGIQPHFVTALDYHEISRRFYESLDAASLRDVTLVADPKVHPVVLDMYPGPVRCCANAFLDRALGNASRPMGELPAGATVAHLAMYLARYLGCDPVAMIGQDLGFPDGLYYAPGAVIHEVWAPELNPFNTLAMMEWQRIARHRLHLIRTQDIHGRTIFTDAQMHAYRQQFERDFAMYAKQGLTTIDASEGGVMKQHAVKMPLGEFLNIHVRRALPPFPSPHSMTITDRGEQARHNIEELRVKIERLGTLSRETRGLLTQMLEHQHDAERMQSLFKRVESRRREVETMMDAFELLNQVNQMGTFRRLRFDRRLHMSRGLDPVTIQRRQLERDLENVEWLADAADEFCSQLQDSLELLRTPTTRSAVLANTPTKVFRESGSISSTQTTSIDALIPVDLNRNGLGIPRSLASDYNGRSVLQATLERLGSSQLIKSIVLVAGESADIESLIDRRTIGKPVEIHRCEGESPFGPEHEAVAVARLFSDTCWRGGIAGMSIYDEVLCPQVMAEVMRTRSMAAALLVAPDWPMVAVEGESGCDALIHRYLEHPEQHTLVFAQAPPGLGACVIRASLMQELAQRNRLATIGALLVYQPHAPQHDPIAREACVQAPHKVKTSLMRASYDSQRWARAVHQSAGNLEALNYAEDTIWSWSPQHVILELNTQRTSRGIFARSLGAGPSPHSSLCVHTATRIIRDLASGGADDLVLTLHGRGDPLLHSDCHTIIMEAKRAGFRAVNLRTELVCERDTLQRILDSGVDVVSVDLNADRDVTYQAMMGCDCFRNVLINIEWLIEHRRRLTSHPPHTALALPWVVPHLQRRAETYEDIDTFYDRWQHTLGTAVIDDPPPADPRPIGLTPAVTPHHVIRREAQRRMTILCDGSVPLDDMSFNCVNTIGNAQETHPLELWQSLYRHRSQIHEESCQ